MKNIIIPIAAGLVGAGVGFYFGFVYGDNKGRKEVWGIAEAEIENTEERVMRRYKVGQWSEPTQYFDEDEQPVQSINVVMDGEVAPEALEALREHLESGTGVTNIFVQASDHKDVDFGETVEAFMDVPAAEDNPNRYDPEPIIITELEYFQDEEDYEKLSVSWYPGDRVLCDSREQVIEDVEGSVGINNLNTVPADRTILYVRNNRLKMDFEIACETGTYRETVLGEDPPIMERSRRKPRARVDTDE